MSIDFLLWILALLCMLGAAFNAKLGSVNLFYLALACVIATQVV